ncbi:MAG: hypothetical protein F4Y04_06680 [Chloroflexi bacterium]|nr:hypothetical protein [Chloroflexota bacterium]
MSESPDCGAQIALECALQVASATREEAGLPIPSVLPRHAIAFIFELVEQTFAAGGWDAVEAAMRKVPEFAEPMGALGPLWIAIQMERGNEVRAAVEFTEVARDVHHNLKKFGRMRPVEMTDG